MANTSRSVARRVLGWPARRVLDRRVEWILASIAEQFDQLETALGESLLGHRLASLQAPGDLALSRDTAQFLNWAEGHEGPAARAGLWFNPPVPIKYDKDSVGVLLVNERIVEQPYVFGALAALPRAARILDVGGSESTVALSLASLGHEVHVVDPRGYPLQHPRLHAHATRLDELPHDERFDAAIALSSIEHFGIGGAYGLEHEDERLDLAALRAIHRHLEADGLLVLTVPCGPASTVDQLQRTYSIADLRELLRAWEIVDFSVAWRRDQLTWLRDGPDETQPDTGVALITARPR